MGVSTSTLISRHKDAIWRDVLIDDLSPQIDDGSNKSRIIDLIVDSFTGTVETPLDSLDPLMLWVVNEDGLSREELQSRLTEMTIFMMKWVNLPIFERGIVLTVSSESGELAGVATLVPPDVNQFSMFTHLGLMFKLGMPPCAKNTKLWGSASNQRFDSLMVIETINRKYYKQFGGFWYLQTLGTSQKFRGKGYGGRLMRTICRISDQYNKCVYLETESVQNEKLYRKYGFETLEKPWVGAKGAKEFQMYCMIRRPVGANSE